MKTCDKCKKPRPIEEFRTHPSSYTSRITGETRMYHYPDKVCNGCRKKERSAYMREYKTDRPAPQDSNAFWFSDDIRVWSHGTNKLRWNRIYQDKKEREELKTPWARI